MLHDGGTFDGAAEMLALLNGSRQLRQCYATRWFEYAIGRPHAATTDQCTIEQLTDRFVESGDIRNLMLDITMSDAFLMRQLEEGE